MTTAYLTIDDGPSSITKDITNFLIEKDIVPIMFFIGDHIKPYWEDGIYALQKGAIIGNHGYSHPHFSELSLDECIEEIEKTEKLIDELYKVAGVERHYRLFRFPYGNKGNDYRDDFQMEHRAALQEYLSTHGFTKIDSSVITYPWYFENNLDNDIDILWTFDFEEYRLHQDATFRYDMIYDHIHNPDPEQGGNFFDEQAHNILLIHDHPQSRAVCVNYYEDIINECLAMGVTFLAPSFVTR